MSMLDKYSPGERAWLIGLFWIMFIIWSLAIMYVGNKTLDVVLIHEHPSHKHPHEHVHEHEAHVHRHKHPHVELPVHTHPKIEHTHKIVN